MNTEITIATLIIMVYLLTILLIQRTRKVKRMEEILSNFEIIVNGSITLNNSTGAIVEVPQVSDKMRTTLRVNGDITIAKDANYKIKNFLQEGIFQEKIKYYSSF